MISYSFYCGRGPLFLCFLKNVYMLNKPAAFLECGYSNMVD